MRGTGRTVSLAAAVLLLAAAGTAMEGFEVEAGLFFHDLNGGQVDWRGERLILRWKASPRATAQLEVVDEERGDDRGQLASAAGWVDWTPHLFTFAALTTSEGADFFPEHRVDLELHFKVPGHERLVLFGGGGEAEFSTADVGFWTAGASYYYPGGVLSYRYYTFDNRAPAGSPARSGNGTTHLVQALFGRPEKGQVELRFLHGEDFLRDFSLSGEDAHLRSRVVYAGWRRHWTERWGTYLQGEWGEKEGIFSRRGLEFRLLYSGRTK